MLTGISLLASKTASHYVYPLPTSTRSQVLIRPATAPMAPAGFIYPVGQKLLSSGSHAERHRLASLRTVPSASIVLLLECNFQGCAQPRDELSDVISPVCFLGKITALAPTRPEILYDCLFCPPSRHAQSVLTPCQTL